MNKSVTIYKIEEYEWHIRVDYPKMELLKKTFKSEAEAVAYAKRNNWYVENISR